MLSRRHWAKLCIASLRRSHPDTSKTIWSGSNQVDMPQSAQNKGTDSAWTWSKSHNKCKKRSHSILESSMGRLALRALLLAGLHAAFHSMCRNMIYALIFVLVYLCFLFFFWSCLHATLGPGLACSPFAVDKSKFRTCELKAQKFPTQDLLHTWKLTRFLSLSKARLFLSKISQVHWQGCHSFTRNVNHVVVSNILTEISSQLPAVECQVRGEPGDSVHP